MSQRQPIQPTSARGQRSRQKLLDAARQVFLDVGYGDANATAITSAAGVSYGSFYVYFTSKEELFTELARELLEEVYVASRAPTEVKDPVQRITTENGRFFEVYREHAAMFQMIEEVIRLDADFRDEWRQIRRKNIDRLARGLRRLQKSGAITVGLDVEYVADALGGLAERMAYLSTLDDGFDVERRLETLNEIWRQTLGLG